MLQLYDHLLQFSLFQGMSRDDLELVAGHTRFAFSKTLAGKRIVSTGQPCQQLIFLISGTVSVETRSADNAYTVVERIQAPYLIQPEAIFGYSQQYTHTFTAITDTSLFQLEKDEVIRLCEDFLVFRLNMLGVFATQAQKLSAQPWRRYPDTLRERVIRFFLQHSVYPAGSKTIHILMNRLAAELNDSRLDISRTLNGLQDEGLLHLYRGRIEIPLLERLLM